MNRKSKLAELRAKTDRQLAAVLRSTLDDGLASARASDVEAERVYAEVLVLLPTLRNVTEVERRRLELKLAQLRTLLDKRPARAMASAACF